jgi:hypothetical protein
MGLDPVSAKNGLERICKHAPRLPRHGKREERMPRIT